MVAEQIKTTKDEKKNEAKTMVETFNIFFPLRKNSEKKKRERNRGGAAAEGYFF